nr:hypothetical protein [Tanacetum cinerariifolium]
MNSTIPLGQKNTLAEYMILADSDNRPPMLDKDLYDSWKSIMELYMQNREHEKMILESVEYGPLIWPTVEENGVTRTKKYAELFVAEKIQADCLVVLVFSLRDDPNACLNKAMAFLTVVASSRSRVPNGQAVQTIIPNNDAFQTENLDTYDSDYDDISNAKAVLMANISNYVSDIISEVPHSETYLNNMENQSAHAMQDFKQTHIVDFIDNEIHSDSNSILYSHYSQETQHVNVQDTNLQAQQDSMILSVIEQMSKQMINHVNTLKKANKEQNNESVTTELERYKERVKTLKQHLNIDLSSREKMIDSQMDDMIKEKLALKEQVDSLE